MNLIHRKLEELPLCKKLKDIYCDDKNLSSNSWDCATKLTGVGFVAGIAGSKALSPWIFDRREERSTGICSI